jgi:hypothetical protein
MWFQGPSRRAEVEGLVAGIHGIVDGMGDSKFGDCEEEEKRLNEEMMAEIRKIR